MYVNTWVHGCYVKADGQIAKSMRVPDGSYVDCDGRKCTSYRFYRKNIKLSIFFTCKSKNFLNDFLGIFLYLILRKEFFVSRKGRCMKDSERTYNRKGVSIPFTYSLPNPVLLICTFYSSTLSFLCSIFLNKWVQIRIATTIDR